MKKYKYKNLSSSEVKIKCKNFFMINYIEDENGNKITIKTLKNERVIFNKNNYYHTFSYEDKMAKTNCIKSRGRIFSYQRARCVLWIKETLIGNNPDAIRKDIDPYVYFYDQKEKYLIVLKKLRSGDLLFITHYFVKNSYSLRKIEKKIYLDNDSSPW